MLPGFTGIASFPSQHFPSEQGVGLADLWTQSVSGRHQEPAGNWVNCTTEKFCSVFVLWCRSRCDNGEDSGWHPCGGCIGIGGLAWDFWG